MLAEDYPELIKDIPFPKMWLWGKVRQLLRGKVRHYLTLSQHDRQGESCKTLIKGCTKLFSVDSYVFSPVESIFDIYFFVLCIINEIISIFDYI